MTEIYHYTTIDALLGILREKEKICLWATDFRFLNDPSEFCIGTQLVNQLLPEIETKLGVHQNEHIAKMFTIDNIKNFSDFFSMIISLSERVDFLPMWNIYGKNGKGVELIFDKDELFKSIQEQFFKQQIVCIIDDCLYYDLNYEKERNKNNILLELEENRQVIIEVLSEYYQKAQELVRDYALERDDLKNCKASYLFANFCPFIKHFAYRDEWEHRISIRLFPPKKKELFELELYHSSYNHDIVKLIKDVPSIHPNFRERNGMLIPYTEILLPLDILKGIIIGPSVNYEQCKVSINMFLESHGINSLPIYQSRVPYIAN